MRRATRQLNEQIDEGKFDPIGIFEKRLEGDVEAPSCKMPEQPVYQDPDQSEHDREA